MTTYHKKARQRRARTKSIDTVELSKTLSNTLLNQFAPQTFDNLSFSPMNDINKSYSDRTHLANNIAEAEGWTPFCNLDEAPEGMSFVSRQGKYVLEPSNKTVLSDDVMPQFSSKYGYGSDMYNANIINRKNDLFTGTVATKIQKQESKALFDLMPTKPATVGLQAPLDKSRVMLSHWKDDVALPTLQPDAPMDPMYRPREKTLEELYVNPRQVIEGRYVQSGLRGTKRSVTGELQTYKQDQFKTMSEQDLIPTRGRSYAPKAQDNFVMKIPHKDSQHREHIGAAHRSDIASDGCSPYEIKGQYAQSRRQNFLMPTHGHAHGPSQYDPNMEAYAIGATNKDLTIGASRPGQVYESQQTYLSNTKPLSTTLKEQTIEGYAQHIVTGEQKGQIYSNTALSPTLKEQLVDNAIHMQVNTQSKGLRVYQREAAKTTLKEQLLETLQPANVYQEGQYLSGNHNIDTTMKELVNVDWTAFTQLAGSQSGLLHTILPLDVTMKEQNLQPSQMYVSSQTESRPLYTTQPLSATLKEQTIENTVHHNIGTGNIRTMRNTQALATTLKEQLIDQPSQQFITDVRTKIRAYNTDPVATTLKEQTIEGHDPRNAKGNGIYVHTNQPIATTLKEQTIDNNRSQSVYTGQRGLLHKTALLDPTLKELTIDDNHLGAANLDTYGKGYGYLTEKHETPTTVKELTIDQEYLPHLYSDVKANAMSNARNAEFRSIREQLQKYRAPTQEGVKVTLGPNSINASFKIDDNPGHAPRLGVTYNPQQRLSFGQTVKDSTRVTIDRFVNPDLLAALDINPYHTEYQPVR